MKCPKCDNGEVKEQISINGFIFKKKTINYFCPLCSWENKKEFKLSKDDVDLEKYERINKDKETTIKHITTRNETRQFIE